MPKRFSLDRFEGDFAVCYDGEGNKYDFPKDLLALETGALFTAELDSEGRPCNVQFLAEETAQKRSELKGRLNALFNRSKKQ